MPKVVLQIESDGSIEFAFSDFPEIEVVVLNHQQASRDAAVKTPFVDGWSDSPTEKSAAMVVVTRLPAKVDAAHVQAVVDSLPEAEDEGPRPA